MLPLTYLMLQKQSLNCTLRPELHSLRYQELSNQVFPKEIPYENNAVDSLKVVNELYRT